MLYSSFPNEHDAEPEEEKQRIAGFRAFAGRLRDQFLQNPVIDEAERAQAGQKTSLSKAITYFRKLAEKQLGRKDPTNSDLLKTDAGKVWDGLRTLRTCLEELQDVAKPDTDPVTASNQWARFKYHFNEITETNEDREKKSFSDALHSLLEGAIGYDDIDDPEVKLACEMGQLIQNVEQEAELLDYQARIYTAKDQIDRYKESRNDLSRKFGALIQTAEQKGVKLKGLEAQEKDARWDLALSKDVLDKHQARHAEMQKAWKEASDEYLSIQTTLNTLMPGIEALKEEQKKHLEGPYGVNAFRENYKQHEDDVRRELLTLKSNMEKIVAKLREDDVNRGKKELHTQDLQIQKEQLNELLSKGNNKKLYAQYRTMKDYDRKLLDIDDKFKQLEKVGVLELLDAEKNKEALSDEDKRILSEYRQLKKDVLEVLVKEKSPLAKFTDKAFKDMENPATNPSRKDVVGHVRGFLGSTIRHFQPKVNEALGKFTAAHSDFVHDVIAIEANKEDFEMRANYVPLTPKERQALEQQLKAAHDAIDEKNREIAHYTQAYCQALGIPYTGFKFFKDMEPLVNRVVEEDAQNLKKLETDPQIPEMKSRLKELEHTLQVNSEEAYKAREQELQASIAKRTGHLHDIIRIQGTFAGLHKEYKDLGAEQAKILKQPLPRGIPNAPDIAERLRAISVRSGDAYDGSHTNTQFFEDMVGAVNSAQQALSQEDVTRQAGIEAMRQVHEAARIYLKEKHDQIRPIASKMRKARLQFAENLLKYSEATIKQLQESAPMLRGGAEVADFVRAGQTEVPDISVENFEEILSNVQQNMEKQRRQAENARQRDDLQAGRGRGPV